MIRSKYLSAFAIAAILGAAPAFADDSAKSGDASKANQGMTQEQQSTDRLPANRAGSDRDDSSASTASGLKPLCSSFKNPNAGKLADKGTGEAKEHSASPVHEDCIPDSTATGTTTSDVTGSTSRMTSSTIPSTPSTMPSTTPSTSGTSSSSVHKPLLNNPASTTK